MNRVDHHEIRKPLGEGGMGVVYRATFLRSRLIYVTIANAARRDMSTNTIDSG